MVIEQVSKRSYEAETQAIARQLLAATQEKRSFLGHLREQMRWDDKLMAWAMDNPGLRLQLFRLIDCLPSLHSKSDIARHLQEYLGDDVVELPATLKHILNFTSPNSLPGQVAATSVATAVAALAHKYIAGETIQQALQTIERLRRDKMTFTMDLLGEAVITESEAQSYLEGYLALMDQLTQAAPQGPRVAQDQGAEDLLPQVQVSVKLTAFYSQFDPLDAEGSQQQVSHRLRILLRRAAELGAAVHFDMEQYAYKDLTLAILKDLLMEEEFRHRTDVGITLQAYLRDSEADLQDLIGWAKRRGHPLTVRLVKGAYWDQETITARQKGWASPVYSHKASTDANFEHLTQLLLENHPFLYAAIGSHNVRSLARAIAVAQDLPLSRRGFELQVLYGMADRLAKALVEQGYRVRVYCPYGKLIPGMSYLIRRLLENTANNSFVRQRVSAQPAELLAAPQMEEEEVFMPVHHNAPDTDYADATNREQAFQAIHRVRQHLGKSYWPLINGEWVSTAQTFDSLNPANPAEVVGQVGAISIEQAEQAVQAAKAAFAAWKQTPAKQRSARLRRAAELMEQRRIELVAWMVFEVGKTIQEGDAEVSEA
ncbi:MAG TPA: proline dehydrogenase family protein, partial [Candidatus Caenarcaniphilales bacterium]